MTAGKKKHEDIDLLYQELRNKYESGEEPTARLFWDSPITEEFVQSLAVAPRLDVLLAWRGELMEDEDEGYLSREAVLPEVWGQDAGIIKMLVLVLDRQARLRRERLLTQRNWDEDFHAWVQKGKLTRRLLKKVS